jgi:hypothetical protein
LWKEQAVIVQHGDELMTCDMTLWAISLLAFACGLKSSDDTPYFSKRRNETRACRVHELTTAFEKITIIDQPDHLWHFLSWIE